MVLTSDTALLYVLKLLSMPVNMVQLQQHSIIRRSIGVGCIPTLAADTSTPLQWLLPIAQRLVDLVPSDTRLSPKRLHRQLS